MAKGGSNGASPSGTTASNMNYCDPSLSERPGKGAAGERANRADPSGTPGRSPISPRKELAMGRDPKIARSSPKTGI